MMKKVSKLKQHNSPNIIKNVVLCGFALRLVSLIFILTVGTYFSDPYFLSDDISYENLARYYMTYATGVLDFDLFDRLTIGYMNNFWPFVECFAAKLFGNVFAGRYVNVILSTICIKIVYDITLKVSNNTQSAIKAAKLFAFLPLTVLTCCFPIKDIFLTLSVMYTFYIFIRIQLGETLKIYQYIICAILLICTYFTRGAVVEMLLIFLVAYYIQKLIKEKKYKQSVVTVFLAIIVFFIFKNQIFDAFQTKIDDYSGYAETGNGINMVKVTGLSNIYKLPLAYAFATLQPIKLNLFSIGSNMWLGIISYLNISIYPIAVGNFIYMFYKKHNLFFWLSSFIMYSAVIMLSLGIFRHYLFLLPIQLINYSLYTERSPKDNTIICIIGALGLFIIICFYSVLSIF